MCQVVAAVPGNPQTPLVETVAGYTDRVRVTWNEPLDNGGSLTPGSETLEHSTRPNDHIIFIFDMNICIYMMMYMMI